VARVDLAARPARRANERRVRAGAGRAALQLLLSCLDLP